MQTDTLFVVLAHRSAKSIFGAATNPIVRNGRLLCFKTEREAHLERDRLNARASAGSHMRYSVKPIHVELRVPSGVAQKAQSAEPRRAVSLSNGSRAATPRAA